MIMHEKYTFILFSALKRHPAWDIRTKRRGNVQYGKTCPCFEEKSEQPLDKSKREEVFSVAFRYTESNIQ
jgi:hypothetical protein